MKWVSQGGNLLLALVGCAQFSGRFVEYWYSNFRSDVPSRLKTVFLKGLCVSIIYSNWLFWYAGYCRHFNFNLVSLPILQAGGI